MRDVRSNITLAFNMIAKDVSDIWKRCLAQYSLGDSNLADETDTNVTFPSILFSYNDYAEYVENGRRPHARKVPIEALVEWAKRKGIPSDNRTLYAIRESIYKNGIKPRNILTTFYDAIDNEMDTAYADMLFDAITENLEEYFN